MTRDEPQVEAVVAQMFAAFTADGDFEALAALFLPGAVIVRAGPGEPLVMDVDAFIAPRRALLTGGELTGFREWSEGGRTEVSGDVAHHWCSYAKSWDGGSGRGAKSVQLVRTPAGWRISALAWDDER